MAIRFPRRTPSAGASGTNRLGSSMNNFVRSATPLPAYSRPSYSQPMPQPRPAPQSQPMPQPRTPSSGDKVLGMDREKAREITDKLVKINDTTDYFAELANLLGLTIIAAPLIDIFDIVTYVFFFVSYGKKLKWWYFLLFLLELIPIIGIFKWNTIVLKDARNEHGLKEKDHGSPSWIKYLLIVFVIIILIASMLPFMGDVASGGMGRIFRSVFSGIVKGWASITDFFKSVNIFQAIGDYWNRQTRIVNGGYYEGQVDENKATGTVPDLGVEITEFKPQSYYNYEDEPVILWGHLQVRALDFYESNNYSQTYIEVHTNCSVDKGYEYLTDKFGEKYYINYFGDQFAECEFEKLPKGARVAKLHATYNFQTNAYLKTYFMDETRINTLRRMGTDPLTEFETYDTHPIAVYTDGPVKLGIGVGLDTVLPLSVPSEINSKTKFVNLIGITIDNRDRINGKIVEVTNIEFQIPESLALASKEEGCDFDAEIVSTTQDNVLQEGYNIYRVNLDDSSIQKKVKDVDSDITLNCKLNIQDRDGLLRNAGFATKYLRAQVNYEYEISKRATIYVKENQDE